MATSEKTKTRRTTKCPAAQLRPVSPTEAAKHNLRNLRDLIESRNATFVDLTLGTVSHSMAASEMVNTRRATRAYAPTAFPHPMKKQRAHEMLRHEPRPLLASAPEKVKGHPVEAHSQEQREQQHLQRQQEADLRPPAATVTSRPSGLHAC